MSNISHIDQPDHLGQCSEAAWCPFYTIISMENHILGIFRPTIHIHIHPQEDFQL